MSLVLSPTKSEQLHKNLLLQYFDFMHTLWLMDDKFTVWSLMHSYNKDMHHFHRNKIALLCLWVFFDENILQRKNMSIKKCFLNLKY